MEELEGIPAIVYSGLWQTREMGFLKKILTDLNIKTLRILLLFKDYLPGALLTLDGMKGDFYIKPVNSPDEISKGDYDGAVIGNMKPIIESLENHTLSKGLWNLLLGKIKLKGKLKLLKFMKVLMRCAL